VIEAPRKIIGVGAPKIRSMRESLQSAFSRRLAVFAREHEILYDKDHQAEWISGEMLTPPEMLARLRASPDQVANVHAELALSLALGSVASAPKDARASTASAFAYRLEDRWPLEFGNGLGVLSFACGVRSAAPYPVDLAPDDVVAWVTSALNGIRPGWGSEYQEELILERKWHPKSDNESRAPFTHESTLPPQYRDAWPPWSSVVIPLAALPADIKRNCGQVPDKHYPDDPNGPPSFRRQWLTEHPVITIPTRAIAICAREWRSMNEERRRPSFRASTSRPARAAVEVLSNRSAPTKASKWGDWHDVLEHDGRFSLCWNSRTSKPMPVQLDLLPDEGNSLDAAILRSMLERLGGDGVCDYFALHRADEVQRAGRDDGRFEYTWVDHKIALGYDKKIRDGNASRGGERKSEADLALETWKRIELFHRSEIFLEVERRVPVKGGGEVRKIDRLHVGEAPIVSISREELSQDVVSGRMVTTRAILRMNKELRVPDVDRRPRRIKGKIKAPPFAHVPDAILRAPSDLAALYFHLMFGWKAANGAPIDRKASTLWRYAGISRARIEDSRRWPEVTRTVDGKLERLGRCLQDAGVGDNFGWQRSNSARACDAIYEITPPFWFRDGAHLHLRPVIEAPLITAGIPATGRELEAWAKSRGSSLRDVGAIVGASPQTIMRAMKLGSRLIKPAWREAIAEATRQKR